MCCFEEPRSFLLTPLKIFYRKLYIFILKKNVHLIRYFYCLTLSLEYRIENVYFCVTTYTAVGLLIPSETLKFLMVVKTSYNNNEESLKNHIFDFDNINFVLLNTE